MSLDKKTEVLNSMLSFFLLPGNTACDMSGIARDSEHGQILRMFINTLVWGTVAVVLTVLALV